MFQDRFQTALRGNQRESSKLRSVGFMLAMFLARLYDIDVGGVAQLLTVCNMAREQNVIVLLW